jgi:hypothetical protein
MSASASCGQGAARSTIEGMEPEDIRLLFEVLFDIRTGVRRTLWLLEKEDGDEEEEDS